VGDMINVAGGNEMVNQVHEQEENVDEKAP